MSVPMKPSDPAYWMLFDEFTTTPVVHADHCYICNDPEFAQMGLPLCKKCPNCVRTGAGLGHIPADDPVCTVCNWEEGPDDYDENWQIKMELND
jgi:hypothetical protein